jgi:hypothetical protein
VYQHPDGSLLVQGYAVADTHPSIEVPAGEVLVKIPASLLSAAVRNLI